MRKERKEKMIKEMIKEMKDIILEIFDNYMDAAKCTIGPYESVIFIAISGIMILLGVAFVAFALGALWLILFHAPWLLAVFAVVFGIPAGLLFWAKRSDKK